MEDNAEYTQRNTEGSEDSFRVREDFADVVLVCVVVGGDDLEDGCEDVSYLFGFGGFLVDLIREDVDTADGVGVTADTFVREFVDVDSEFFTDAGG